MRNNIGNRPSDRKNKIKKSQEQPYPQLLDIFTARHLKFSKNIRMKNKAKKIEGNINPPQVAGLSLIHNIAMQMRIR